MMARLAFEWEEGLPAEKALAARPRPSLHSEKVAGHLAYTMLLMHRAPTRRAEKELDSTWAYPLEFSERSAIGAYG